MDATEPGWKWKRRRRAWLRGSTALLLGACVLWASGCFVMDALGFRKSPLLPTVAGPEAPELVERLRGTLAVVGVGARDCCDLLELPSRAERELCVPSDHVRADASTVGNVLVHAVDDYGGTPASGRFGLRIGSLDAPGEARELVGGAGELGEARVGVGARGEWAAIAWATRPAGATPFERRLELVSLAEPRIVWSRAIDCVGAVGVHEAARCVVFTDCAGADRSVRIRGFDADDERELVRGVLLAFDRELGVALVAEGESLRCVSVPGGEVTIANARLPGLAGAVIGLWDGELALYEALPTEGASQARYRMGLSAPEPFSTIKVANLRTGEFATVVSRALLPGSFAFR
ncbi:MAG: hypothetical protein IT453_21345 [Planctomycetes bacterium]|nr:hypothetical protein [Planctomycetota bacterium]